MTWKFKDEVKNHIIKRTKELLKDGKNFPQIEMILFNKEDINVHHKTIKEWIEEEKRNGKKT